MTSLRDQLLALGYKGAASMTDEEVDQLWAILQKVKKRISDGARDRRQTPRDPEAERTDSA